MILAEWASTEAAGDDGAAKAGWIAEASQLFRSPGWEQFVAISYFNHRHPGRVGHGLVVLVASDPEALSPPGAPGWFLERNCL